MLNNPLGRAAEERALVTSVAMGRDHNEIRFELSRSGANLFVRGAGAWLERRDIAIGPVFPRKGLEPFHESPIPFRLRHQRKRQQGRRRLLATSVTCKRCTSAPNWREIASA